AAAGGEAAAFATRRWPRGWWLPGSAAVVGFSAAFLFLAPVVLDPIFNRFERLPEGDTRDAVLDLAGRAGVRVGEVYVVDASRRAGGRGRQPALAPDGGPRRPLLARAHPRGRRIRVVRAQDRA